MQTILVKHKQCKLDRAIALIRQRHPTASFIGLLIGIPLFIMTSVLVSATAIMLPISFVMGWL